jgi:hypothetical protein
MLQKAFCLPLSGVPLYGKKVKKVALCGGAGSFLIGTALPPGLIFTLREMSNTTSFLRLTAGW